MEIHSIRFHDKYRLELTENEAGTQSLVLVRNDGGNDIMTFNLDMSDILRQCKPLALVERVIDNMENGLQAAVYTLDNYRHYKSAQQQIEDFRTSVNRETDYAAKLIKAITHEEVLATADSDNDTPF